MDHTIRESLLKLKLFIEKEDYRGFDPYDALTSPLFNLPGIRTSSNMLFLAQQLVKRSPVNLRPLLLIKKGLNPVTLGLCIQAYSDLGNAGVISKDESHTKIERLITLLEEMIPGGFSGACWGYDFPWQSRHFKLGAYQPSVVATGIISNALFRYYEHTNHNRSFDLCKSAADFILNDLNRLEDPDGSICFSYTPFDHYRVYNASMKAVRILSQVYSVTGEKSLFETAKKAATFVVKNQNKDGSWFYAPGDKGHWIDSYHTGYVLECLNAYAVKTGDHSFDKTCDIGYNYFIHNFIENGTVPKFYSNEIYPIDCTSGAQTIITLCRFNQVETAKNVAKYLIAEMQHVNGGFYFRKTRFLTEKTSFMRWSNAWMLAALSTLLMNTNDH